MIVSCLLPLVAAVAFGLGTPEIAKRVRPAAAVWILSAGGLLLAACPLLAAALVSTVELGRVPGIAHLGHWSARLVGLYTPYQPWFLYAVGAALVLSLTNAALVGSRHLRRLSGAWSTSRSTKSDLVVLADPRPIAFAMPGWPGRIVVSQGLLRRLDPISRQAVLAHERAHLSGRHDLHQTAAVLARGLNPLLGRLPASLTLACERRADEIAARRVGNRRAVARAIAEAATPLAGPLWAASGADVPLRVHSLLDPPTWTSRLLAGALALTALLVLTGSLSSVLWLGHDLRAVIVLARRGR